MNVTVQIPDDLAKRLAASGDDLSRRAHEGFALEEYKSGHITKAELRRLRPSLSAIRAPSII
jgi:hypothetical protein